MWSICTLQTVADSTGRRCAPQCRGAADAPSPLLPLFGNEKSDRDWSRLGLNDVGRLKNHSIKASAGRGQWHSGRQYGPPETKDNQPVGKTYQAPQTSSGRALPLGCFFKSEGYPVTPLLVRVETIRTPSNENCPGAASNQHVCSKTCSYK